MMIKQLYIHVCIFFIFLNRIFLLAYLSWNMKLFHTKTKYTLLAKLLYFSVFGFYTKSAGYISRLIKLPKAEIHVHPKLYKNESQSLTFLFIRIMDIYLIFIFWNKRSSITLIFISYLLLRAASQVSDMAHRQLIGWVHLKDVHDFTVGPQHPYMLWYDNGDCIPIKMTTKQNKIKVLKVLIVLYRSPISIRSMLVKCFYNDKCRQMKCFF